MWYFVQLYFVSNILCSIYPTSHIFLSYYQIHYIYIYLCNIYRSKNIRPRYEYVKCTLGIPKYTKLVQETFYYLFEFKGFSTRGERGSFSFYANFSIWTPPRAAPPQQTTGLASAKSENRLASFKPKSQPTRSEFKSQLTAFFQIPKSSARRFRAWRHSPPR